MRKRQEIDSLYRTPDFAAQLRAEADQDRWRDGVIARAAH